MKRTCRILIAILFTSIFFSCNAPSEDAPDLSDMDISVKIERFDADVFSIKLPYLKESLILLKTKYPKFYNDYMANILGLDESIVDVALGIGQYNPKETASALQQLKKFLTDYQPIYPLVAQQFTDMSPYEKDLTQAFKYLTYYFPNFKQPRVLTFIGPADALFFSSLGATQDIISDRIIGISLLLHTSPDLKTDKGKYLFKGLIDDYILRRCTPRTIVSNCVKNIVEDLFPDNSAGAMLMEQMIEKGKRFYAVKKVLPQIEDSLLFNYTATQMTNCLQNEAHIWKFIKSLDILYKKDPQMVRTYVGEAPFTPTISKECPGNIGSWLGYRMVLSYADSHPETHPAQLMKLDAQTVFLGAHYKPKNKK